MDITTLAAWGEFIGGIAVVVSLIYLAGQIRQNSRLVRASTTGSTNQVMTTMTAMLAKDPETTQIFFGASQIPTHSPKKSAKGSTRWSPSFYNQRGSNFSSSATESVARTNGFTTGMVSPGSPRSPAGASFGGNGATVTHPGFMRWWTA